MGGIYDPEIAELLGGPPSASSDESVPVGFQGANRHGTDLMIAGDAYEGANRFSHELASYVPSTRSPDQDIKPGKRTADARARDLTRSAAPDRGQPARREEDRGTQGVQRKERGTAAGVHHLHDAIDGGHARHQVGAESQRRLAVPDRIASEISGGGR